MIQLSTRHFKWAYCSSFNLAAYLPIFWCSGLVHLAVWCLTALLWFQIKLVQPEANSVWQAASCCRVSFEKYLHLNVCCQSLAHTLCFPFLRLNFFFFFFSSWDSISSMMEENTNTEWNCSNNISPYEAFCVF